MKKKMIQVDFKTHSMAKMESIKRGYTLAGYIKMLVEKDVKKESK